MKETEWPIYLELGRRVKSIRSSRGITQSSLARLLKLSRGSIANIETGRQAILWHTALEICEVLQVDLTALIAEPKATDLTPINHRIRAIVAEQKLGILRCKLQSILKDDQ